MHKILLLASALHVFAMTAHADVIGLYADTFAGSCSSAPVLFPAVTHVYIIHQYNVGSVGAQFKVDDTSGLIQAGFASDYLVVGDFFNGATVAYGICYFGQVNMARLDFYWLGQPTTCENQLRIVPDPNRPPGEQLVTADCSNVIKQASAGYFTFQNLGPAGGCCIIAPVQSSTWGSVKALYR